MNPHFKAVAKTCFPNAKIVADRYHVSRQVIWAMDNVRKAEQKRLSVRFRKYFKQSKSLLSKPSSELSDEEKNRLALMFEISPRLASAYRLKRDFLKIMHTDSATAKPLLAKWLLDAENAGFSEFKSCIKAYHNWSEEILNSLDVPWSNGFTEGCNNKTKVLKRACFGVRNFSRFRNRILHLTGA
jgi:transposase